MTGIVLRAMGYMTEQPTLTSKKQTVTVPFWVNCLIYSGTNNRKFSLFPFFLLFFFFFFSLFFLRRNRPPKLLLGTHKSLPEVPSSPIFALLPAQTMIIIRISYNSRRFCYSRCFCRSCRCICRCPAPKFDASFLVFAPMS
jgi:hypothetical protein